MPHVHVFIIISCISSLNFLASQLNFTLYIMCCQPPTLSALKWPPCFLGISIFVGHVDVKLAAYR